MTYQLFLVNSLSSTNETVSICPCRSTQGRTGTLFPRSSGVRTVVPADGGGHVSSLLHGAVACRIPSGPRLRKLPDPPKVFQTQRPLPSLVRLTRPIAHSV